MTPTQIAVALGLALLLAWALRPQAAPAPPSGIQIVLPPIPIAGVSQETAESILSRLQPQIRPRLFPLGWTVSWPSVEIPTDFGTAKVDLPPVELPFVPYGEAVRLLEKMRPQLVNTASGLAVQITTTIPT